MLNSLASAGLVHASVSSIPFVLVIAFDFSVISPSVKRVYLGVMVAGWVNSFLVRNLPDSCQLHSLSPYLPVALHLSKYLFTCTVSPSYTHRAQTDIAPLYTFALHYHHSIRLDQATISWPILCPPCPPHPLMVDLLQNFLPPHGLAPLSALSHRVT